ncbi:radial spoke head 14 homolog [Eucyclogobius newberryi]|uniref:radial spoke head 14 homolog n=1 Tax=Eucyclogobius newberryi TaxID=166745 RepID=UPI003B5BBC3B
MALAVADQSRAPVAYGLRAVPQLFEELKNPDPGRRWRALNSLCDLLHDPERLHQTITSGLVEELSPLLRDPDSTVRTRTCDLLHLLTAHAIGRRALLSSSLLAPLSLLLNDPDCGCRTAALRVLHGITLLPSGTEALLSLVPKLFQKLRETIQDTDEALGRKEGAEEGGSKEGTEEGGEQGDTKEEELVLLLSILERCSRLDAVPALTSDGVVQLQVHLNHGSAHVRKEAAAAMMALSVPLEGKQQICAQGVLSDILTLLQDPDTEVKANAAGVCMNALVITKGKLQCLDLGLIPVLLDIVSSEDLSVTSVDPEQTRSRRVLVLYCLRALTLLSEAPAARRLLMEERPRLEKWRHMDPELSRAAETALRVISWTP